jgi:uncharacterized protein YndB with AHSA1/START domain
MDTATDTTIYERTLSIAASPETVWEFLVEPEKLMRWKGIKAGLDARPGGGFWCEVIPGHTARGEYVEVDEPRRLVFTWGWDGNEGIPPACTSSTATCRVPRRSGRTHRAGITTCRASRSRPGAASRARTPG